MDKRKWKKRNSKGEGDKGKFLYLWPRNFVRPYGQGLEEDELEDQAFVDRLTSANCYWLHEPPKAVSTLVQSLQDCTQLIGQMEVHKMDWQKHVSTLQKLINNIAVLNTRAENSGDWGKSFKILRKICL